MSTPTVVIKGFRIIIPASISRTRKHKASPLTKDERAYNHALNRFRVRVEHSIARLKTFRILSERYRYPRSRYAVKTSTVAGIINFAAGF